MSEQKTTNLNDFMGELGAGVFQAKIEHCLSEAALNTILHGSGNKKGKVTMEFTFTQIGENDQVVVSHKLVSSTPTKRGKRVEEDLTDTPMFVGKYGVLSVEPPKEEMTGQFHLRAAQ